jgi:hypothetical protein
MTRCHNAFSNGSCPSPDNRLFQGETAAVHGSRVGIWPKQRFVGRPTDRGFVLSSRRLRPDPQPSHHPQRRLFVVSGRNWRFSHHASLPESDESTESRPTIVGQPIQSCLEAAVLSLRLSCWYSFSTYRGKMSYRRLHWLVSTITNVVKNEQADRRG